MVEGKKTMFYLYLLEYIDTQNVRLIRQREELIDLSVKIANLNHRDDTEKAMEEVLRDMITQIKVGHLLRK